MKLNKPLNTILGNKTRVEILRTFFKYPGEFTGRHVARLCKLPQATVQKQLQVLADNNILNFKQVGRSKTFSLNTENILYPALKALYEAESKVLSQIENLIKQTIKRSPYLRNQFVHASIYGSVVTGEETSQSDIDLFLLSLDDFDKNRVNEKLEKLQEKILATSGMYLHPYVLSLKDWKKMNKSLLRSIEENSKLIYGEDLKELKKKWQKRRKQKRPA